MANHDQQDQMLEDVIGKFDILGTQHVHCNEGVEFWQFYYFYVHDEVQEWVRSLGRNLDNCHHCHQQVQWKYYTSYVSDSQCAFVSNDASIFDETCVEADEHIGYEDDDEEWQCDTFTLEILFPAMKTYEVYGEKVVNQ